MPDVSTKHTAARPRAVSVETWRRTAADGRLLLRGVRKRSGRLACRDAARGVARRAIVRKRRSLRVRRQRDGRPVTGRHDAATRTGRAELPDRELQLLPAGHAHRAGRDRLHAQLRAASLPAARDPRPRWRFKERWEREPTIRLRMLPAEAPEGYLTPEMFFVGDVVPDSPDSGAAEKAADRARLASAAQGGDRDRPRGRVRCAAAQRRGRDLGKHIRRFRLGPSHDRERLRHPESGRSAMDRGRW